jgi:hypothetical protein
MLSATVEKKELKFSETSFASFMILCIVEIKNRVDIDNNFDFQNITTERVEKIINTINIKKATGADNIPAPVALFK